MTHQPEYVFATPDLERERERLLAVQDEFDAATFARLERLGVQRDWTCLEIGCGAGSVLRWLAERTAHAVGLDLDPRMVGDVPANVEVRQADVATADLGEAVFDLAHARFVFIHVRQRDAALRNVLRALKPGGWLLLEEPDFSPARAVSDDSEDAAVITKMYEATRQMYLKTGGDPFLGRRLVGWLQGHGLHVEGAEASVSLWRGGSHRARLRRQGVEHLWSRLLDTGAVTEADLQRFLALALDPGVWAFDYTTVAVWARKTGTGVTRADCHPAVPQR